MKNLYFLDKKLSHIFNEFDSFERLKDMDGEVFRKYERRITKRFQVNEKNYLTTMWNRESKLCSSLGSIFH